MCILQLNKKYYGVKVNKASSIFLELVCQCQKAQSRHCPATLPARWHDPMAVTRVCGCTLWLFLSSPNYFPSKVLKQTLYAHTYFVVYLQYYSLLALSKSVSFSSVPGRSK